MAASSRSERALTLTNIVSGTGVPLLPPLNSGWSSTQFVADRPFADPDFAVERPIRSRHRASGDYGV